MPRLGLPSFLPSCRAEDVCNPRTHESRANALPLSYKTNFHLNIQTVSRAMCQTVQCHEQERPELKPTQCN